MSSDDDDFHEEPIEEENDVADDDDDDNDDDNKDDMKKVKNKLLNKKKLKKYKDKVDNSGVVYLSRIPPHMKPQKLRHLLGQYGEIGRLYLTPENPALHKKRVKSGGNRKKNFTNGWVEFMDKNVAKRVAVSLNTTPIGGKSTSFFSNDLWCIKYLSKFKWHHLTEKLAFDSRVRRERLMSELSQAKKERDFYLEKVESAKNIERKQKKAQRKQQANEYEENDNSGDEEMKTNFGKKSKQISVEPAAAAVAAPPPTAIKRKFKQREMIAVTDTEQPVSKSLLSKIFHGGRDETPSQSASKKSRNQ